MTFMPVLEIALELPGVGQSTIWEFHRDPRALLALTPPNKKIGVVSRPPEMGQGARVVLRVQQFGVSVEWISLIETWEPPARFVDVQEKGPFRRWRHEHLFYDGRLVDRVEYEVPLAMAGGRVVDRLLVRPDLERMFAYRHRVTARELLGTR
jgi:uncharacterized protein